MLRVQFKAWVQNGWTEVTGMVQAYVVTGLDHKEVQAIIMLDDTKGLCTAHVQSCTVIGQRQEIKIS